MRARGLGLVGVFGIGLLVLGVTAIAMNLALPWLVSTPANAIGISPVTALPSGVLERADLGAERARNPYFDDMADWPLTIYILTLPLAVLLVAIDEFPGLRAAFHRGAQTSLLVLLSLFGFLLTLSGSRWVGLLATSVLDRGPSWLSLHVVPYLNLFFGLLFLASGLELLRPRWRTRSPASAGRRFGADSPRVLLAALVLLAVGLATLPLLPLGSVETSGGTDYVHEIDLAAASLDPQDPLSDAARNYGFARGLLWSMVFLSLAAVAMGRWERTGSHPVLESLFVLSFGVGALPLVIGGVFAVLFEVSLNGASQANLSVNLILPALYIALAILYATYARKVLLPFLRHVRRSMPA